MVVRAYAVCIRVTPECRWMESEMIGDGWGGVQTRCTMTHMQCPGAHRALTGLPRGTQGDGSLMNASVEML